MRFLNYLIGTILLSGTLVAEEGAGGWFSIEQPQKLPAESDEDDPSIWVVFTKNIGAEKFLLRFPKDPSLKQISSDRVEISSLQDGASYQLSVEKAGDVNRRLKEVEALPGVSLIRAEQKGAVLDLHYRLGEKWVYEHLSLTFEHLYLFQTTSPEANEENHRLFVNSFQFI
ncbi:MAG: hypothetical protein V4487_03535 [Chlamydiota bacterium]